MISELPTESYLDQSHLYTFPKEEKALVIWQFSLLLS